MCLYSTCTVLVQTVWLGGAGCSNWAGQGSPACQLGLTLTSLLLLAILGYITSAMHTRLISLEHQLRMKIGESRDCDCPSSPSLAGSVGCLVVKPIHRTELLQPTTTRED